MLTSHFEYEYIDYDATGRFSKVVLDYIAGAESLRPFYQFEPTAAGVKQAIEARKKSPVNRKLLVNILRQQYEGLDASAEAVIRNIGLLAKENTFTVCTAHQPNLFTGPLYFIYKILHAIKMSASLGDAYPEFRFVPVYFMGSEDADAAELNHFALEGKKYEWETNQSGAVGRMLVDDELLKLITAVEGRLLAEPFGIELVTLLKECYTRGRPIERATFLFVHALFKSYGLVIFLPDNTEAKKEMSDIFEQDLFKSASSRIVERTSEQLSVHFDPQAFPRDINLFYLINDSRSRIVQSNDQYIVQDIGIQFSEDELRRELKKHPERFSPNVILRGLLQEKLLPDVAFIGGGGELAYWLQLKDLFDEYGVFYPVLLLRNSFLLIEKDQNQVREKLSLPLTALFQDEHTIFRQILKNENGELLSLEKEIAEVISIYDDIAAKARQIDKTLVEHLAALRAKHVRRLNIVEKKFIAAEKKNHDIVGRQLHKLLETLFPGGGLQERSENFMLFYAKWGHDFFDEVYKASPVLDAKLTVIMEQS